MIKKSMVLAAAAIFLSSTFAANAQLFPYTGTSSTPSSSVIDASSTASSSVASSSMISSTISATSTALSSITSSSSSTTITTTILPVIPGTAGTIGEYLQIDGLTVVSVPTMGINGPVQVIAASPAYDTVTAAGTLIPASTAAVTCTQFATESSPTGMAADCPPPPMTTIASGTGTYYSPYMINVNAATQLLMDDRTPATLADISPGDTINVYGYYDGNGIMDAEILRDTSISASGGMNVTSTATLRAELDQLENLVTQLEADLAATSTVTITTTTTSTTVVTPALGTSLYCPMIAASGATSSVLCPPASSTTSGASAIYE